MVDNATNISKTNNPGPGLEKAQKCGGVKRSFNI